MSLLTCFVVLSMGATSILGCSRAAVVLQSREAYLEPIKRADENYVYLELQDGSEYPVHRSDIVDIHHPGVGAAITGGVLAGIGGIIMLPIAASSDWLTPFTVQAGIGLGVGAPLFVGGLIVWRRSVNAAEHPGEDTASALRVAPWLMGPSDTDDGRYGGGIAATASF